MNPPVVPSVNLTYYYYYEKWSFLMAKSTNEMTMFNSYVKLPESIPSSKWGKWETMGT